LPYKDKEKKKEFRRKSYKNNLEYYRKYHQGHKKERNEYERNRYKTDLKFNITKKMSKRIRDSLKDNKNGRRWEDLVGYNLNKLVNRLKKTIPRGYTWVDYLEKRLHIDHIIPKSAFNYTRPENPDFKRCWALNNLRLLPKKENLNKHNKLDKPFQPTLQISISNIKQAHARLS